MIRVLAFDADDTLWENEPLFREAEAAWAGVLRDYGTLESLSAALYAVESSNMAELGYGTKAFIISLLETAIQVSGGNLTAAQTSEIIRIGRRILQNPAGPLPGVEETLSTLHGRFRMVLLTKGDALEQRHKVERSGLARYFDLVDIVPQKTVREYFELCRRLDIGPDELLMVGTPSSRTSHRSWNWAARGSTSLSGSRGNMKKQRNMNIRACARRRNSRI